MATRPSLEELLEGVPTNKLDKPCKDVHLCEIALSVTNWKSVAPFLGISVAVEEEIEKDEGKTRTQRIAMLRKWKELYGRKATYRKLAAVFWKLERADLVDEVASVLADSESSSCDEEEVLTQRNILGQYAAHLRSKYPKEIPSFTQWPPPPTRKFFNLAMIHRHRISLGPIDEKYIRLTQRGNVDDIMSKKTAIQLKDIFCSALQVSLGSKNRMIVLVEGAPGAGKSTLAWYICEQWGSGILFCEFKLVVFVQLRSPAVQSATSIADLLPRMANGKEREVLSHLEARYGKDVLFVLDGWDEYSGDLTQDGICEKLICSPADLSMQESTLLITSRPVASGKLQQLCSARVEIIGFSPTEVKCYFRQALIEARQEQQVEVLQKCLKVRRVIQASCYLPLNAAIVVHLFITEGNTLPTTLHGLFTSLVLNTIVRHVCKQKGGMDLPKMTGFDDIPTELLPQFNAICSVAFHGIKNNKASFTEDEVHSLNISTSTTQPLLSLIKGWSTFRSAWQEKSYSFIHLSVQELLAAFHISRCPATEQVQEIKNLFGRPRFAAVLHYYAAFTRFQVQGIREFLKEIFQQDIRQAGQSYNYPHNRTIGVTTKKTPTMRRSVCKSILHSLYETQDPSLSQYVASLMEGRLTVDYTVSPLDCMILGYFLHCLCLTPGGGEFHINLESSRLNVHKCNYLINELKKSKDGKLSLSLSGNGVDESVATLAHILQESCSHCITKLSIHDSPKNKPAFNHLTKALSACNNIPVIAVSILSRTLIHGHKSSTKLIEVLSKNKTLETLNISGVSLGPQFLSALSGFLCESVTLKTLIMSHGFLDMQGAQALADSLATNSTLEKLDLSHFRLPVEGATALVESLATNTSLKVASFSDCSPKVSAGVLAVSQARRSCSRVCNLSKLSLTLTGARDLSEYLTKDSTVEELNLSQCNIPLEGAIILGDSIARNSSLKTVHYWNVKPAQSKGALAVAIAVRSNQKIWDLSGLTIPMVSAETLAAALALTTTVETLDLSRCNVPLRGATALANSLTRNSSLKRLHIFRCSPAVSRGALAVAFALRSPRNCNLSGHNIPHTSMQLLASCLTKNSKIRVLNLSSCRLTVEGAIELAGALGCNTTLEKLSLSHCFLAPKGAAIVAASLAKNMSVQILDLSNSSVASEYAKAFAPLSTRTTHLPSSTLKKLNMAGCVLSFKAARALAVSLASSTTLETLNLAGCEIPPEGVTAIACSLVGSSTLISLDLSASKIYPKCAEALAALTFSSRLEYLNFSECIIPFKGARVLSDTLANNCTLKRLDCSGCVPPESAVALQVCLAIRLGLKTWELSGRLIPRKGAQALGDFLSRNSVVQSLNLSRCILLPEAVSALTTSLAASSSLKELNLQECGSEITRVPEGIAYVAYGHSGRSPLPIQQVSDFLAITSTLKTLNLSHSNISLNSTVALATALQHTQSVLKILNLSGCSIPLEGATVLSEFLARNITLEVVKHPECHPPASDGVLAVALAVRSSQETWNLSGLAIPVKGTKILADSLASVNSATHVESLDLSGCVLTLEGGRMLARSFARNETLKTLQLSGFTLVPDVEYPRPFHDESDEFLPSGVRKVTPECKMVLSELLAINTALETLNLSRCSIPLEAATTLAASLEDTKSCLQTLDLSYCDIPEESAAALAASLDLNSTLKAVHTPGCQPRSAGLLTVSLAIRSGLEMWDLSGHTIPAKANTKLAESLISNSTVKLLDLSECILSPEGIRFLANSLSTNSSLKSLNLSRCCIVSEDAEDEDADNSILEPYYASSFHLYSSKPRQMPAESVEVLACMLTVNSTLKDLNLSFCQIPLEGVKAIANLLQNANSTLKILNLSGCDIPVEGATALADSLVRNSTLDVLHFVGCRPPESPGLLAVSLAVRSSLEICDLSGHTIPTNGAKLLADFLVSSSTMKMLNLSGCTLSPEGARCLGSSLAKTSSLLSLDLSMSSIVPEDQTSSLSQRTLPVLTSRLFNSRTPFLPEHPKCSDISPESARAMAALLTISPSLETLNLSYCYIPLDAVKALAVSLNGNSVLKVLNLKGCIITLEGISAIAVALTDTSALKTLNLSFCGIVKGDEYFMAHNTTSVIPLESATSLANYLATNSSLEILNLSNCHMTLEGATLFADALSVNTTLKTFHYLGTGRCWSRGCMPRESVGTFAVSLALRANLKTWHFSGLTMPLVSVKALASDLRANSEVEELNLSQCTITLEGISVLASSLVTNSNLKILSLAGIVMSQEGASALAGSLTRNSTLKTLDLSGCVIPPQGMKAIAGALAENTSLTSLNMSGVIPLDPQQNVPSTQIYFRSNNATLHVVEVVRTIALSLAVNTSLETLDLSQWVISFEDARSLANSMTGNVTVKDLKLSRCEIPPRGITILAGSLAKNSTLKALDLSSCTMTPESVRDLAKLLSATSGLERLNISGCDIPLEGARSIAASVAKNPTLRALCFSKCQPNKSSGILAVSMAIRLSSSTWDLSGCTIPLESAFDLVSSLTVNSTVETLNLSQCSVAPEGMSAFAGALARNQSLKTLNLSGSRIPLMSVKVLTQYFASNLKTLDLSMCTITRRCAKELAGFLATNPALETLNVSGCRITAQAARALANSLAKNSILKVLCCSNCKPSESEGMLAVSLAIRSNLDTWNFSRLTIPLESARELATSLEHSSTLMTLNLEHCQVSQDGVTLVVLAVARSSSLKSLNLSGCTIQKEAIKALATTLTRNHQLKELNLSDCYIQGLFQEGALALAKSLAVNRTLETLMLPGEYSNIHHMYHLAEALKVNSTLRTLQLKISRSYVRRTEFSELEFLLAASQSIQSLILSHSDLSSPDQCGTIGIHYLARGLRKNKALRNLSIAYCSLTDYDMELIVGALEHNALLQELDFSHNRLTDSGLHIVSERLKAIDSLQKVTSCHQFIDPEY